VKLEEQSMTGGERATLMNAEISSSAVSTTGDYRITIKHCNSIGQANFSLRPSSLNIKYGPNGIGKSTIARALTLRAAGTAASRN
jgi:hypothetical protein